MADSGIGYSASVGPKSSSSSLPITPANEVSGTTAPTSRPASAALSESQVASEEVLRLKLELAQAQNKLSRLDQELTYNRPPQQIDQYPSGSASDVGGFTLNPAMNFTAAPSMGLQGPIRNTFASGFTNTWPPAFSDDARSDTSEAMSASGFGRPRAIWNNKGNPQHDLGYPGPATTNMGASGSWGVRGVSQGYMLSNPSYGASGGEGYRQGRYAPDYDMTLRPQNARRGNRFDDRSRSPAFGNSYGGYGGHHGQFDAGPHDPAYGQALPGASSYNAGYQPQPIGTPLSPLATEFTAESTAQWKSEVCEQLRTGILSVLLTFTHPIACGHRWSDLPAHY